MVTLIWFQRDLRLQDNAALNHALHQGGSVAAVYVHSPQEDKPWTEGAASRWWLHHSLAQLRDRLRQMNIELQFFRGNSGEIIPRLADFYQATTVTWTGRHEPHRRQFEQTIADKLQQNGINVHPFSDELLSNPGQFLTMTGKTPYRVFTPFYKRLRSELHSFSTPVKPDTGQITPSQLARHTQSVELDQLQLLDKHHWHKKLHQYWTPGESGAATMLDEFINNSLQGYLDQRDFPATNGTSRLSPHLHFGELSPGQILDALTPLIEFDHTLSKPAEGFLRQLIWREFSRYILFHYPETVTEPMNKKYTTGFWINDPVKLAAWQRGNTGVPIIDAGMKQLWETGSMHNRVRMLVASLLTKNLGISWQEGARWFWETLVDADLANNTMGWQWVAGCGVDAAPYFRIFNPETQAKRYDPDRRYTDHWLQGNTTLSTEIPTIDLATTRKAALDKYHHLIRSKTS